MDQIHVIRHKVLVEGEAIREVAREMGVAEHRQAVPGRPATGGTP